MTLSPLAGLASGFFLDDDPKPRLDSNSAMSPGREVDVSTTMTPHSSDIATYSILMQSPSEL